MSRRFLVAPLVIVVVSGLIGPPSAKAAGPTPVPSSSSAATPIPLVTPSPSPTPTTPSPTPSAPSPAPSVPGGQAATAEEETALPPMPDEYTSVHGEMLAEHAGDDMGFEPGGTPTVDRAGGGRGAMVMGAQAMGAVAAMPAGMQREVLGFLPYWMLTDSALAEMNYQLVSTIAYFSVGARTDGNLDKGTASSPSSGWAGWTSSRMTRVIDSAHAAGGKVVLTVTMMASSSAGYDRMRTLLNSSTARARLASQIVDAVRQRNADGVNLDFELVPTDLKAAYTSFVRQVKAALVGAGVGSYLTVCTTGGAATWATGYDIAGLTASGAANALFVMGYDFHWSGSARAGGVAPVDSPYVLDVSSAMADFLERVPASKIIWGVPYYGRGWNTTSSALNGVTAGGSFSYYYTGHVRDAATYGRMWDSVGKVPWYRYRNGSQWVQVYYDDATSLGIKYDLVNRYDLAGTGMWTLLMDGSRNELWRLIADRFVNDISPPVGGVRTLPQKTRSMAIEVSWEALDYQSGLDYYNVQVRDRSTSTWAAWLSGTRATRAAYLGRPGTTYEFRVQAVDWKGNKQPWQVAPGMAAAVGRGSFAVVTTSNLNVRSGAGTSYGIVDTLGTGDRVYVLSGPTAANGYTWFQVQYGFNTWPSTDYARIGWAAVASGASTYLTPAYAPTVTRLDPLLDGYALTMAAFSPNGDGRRDVIGVRYTLPSAVSDMRVDIVDGTDRVVRHLALGSQSAGANVISWDGRATDGTFAADGRYLIKVIVTTPSGEVIASPAAIGSSNVVARWGFTLDRTAPRVTGAAPAVGAAMRPASTAPTLTFSESMTGLTMAGVHLERTGGSSVPASLGWAAGSRRLTITPADPLATGATYRAWLDSTVTDLAGNPVASWETTFSTAPGVAIEPAARMKVLAGTHTAYAVGASGDVTSARTVTFGRASGAPVSQRATLPNLPGRWLYVESGTWAGMWLPEAPGTHLAGETERIGVASTTRLTITSGAHSAYRFSSTGTVTATRTATLAATSGANVSARAIINGQPYWYVTNGIWANWWMPESKGAYRPGFVQRTDLPSLPRIALAAGGYTGRAYDAAGRRTSATTATLARASSAPVSAWAVINGRPHYLVAAGIWAGTWLPAEARITLAP